MTADNRSARSVTHATRRWSGGLAEMLGLAQERQHALTGPERLYAILHYVILQRNARSSAPERDAQDSESLEIAQRGSYAVIVYSNYCVVVIVCRAVIVDALALGSWSCTAGLLTAAAAVVRLFDCFAWIFMSAARMYRVSDSRPSTLFPVKVTEFMFARRGC